MQNSYTENSNTYTPTVTKVGSNSQSGFSNKPACVAPPPPVLSWVTRAPPLRLLGCRTSSLKNILWMLMFVCLIRFTWCVFLSSRFCHLNTKSRPLTKTFFGWWSDFFENSIYLLWAYLESCSLSVAPGPEVPAPGPCLPPAWRTLASSCRGPWGRACPCQTGWGDGQVDPRGWSGSSKGMVR